MEFLQKIQAIWNNVSLVQRAMLIAIGLTFVIAGVFLTQWASKPEMRLLYDDLDMSEAGKIADKIAEKDVAYELCNGGKSIYVPNESVYQLRLEMAKEGLPSGSQGGFKIFDDEKLGVSPFVQNVNLLRALQEELAKSIQMIEGVNAARVHIVKPEQSLFAAGESNTSSSVVLQIRAGYKLSPINVASITHLVAGSVEGLKAENVTVVDSEGNLLSRESDNMIAGGAGTVQDYRERIEQNLSRKAEEMLTTVLGHGRASVKVSAVVDMNSTSIVMETYEPKGVPTKEEIRSESEMKAAGGEEAVVMKPTRKQETVTTEMVVGRTVKEQVVLPGKITSLRVAAFVDLTAEGEEGQESAKIMEVGEVEEILRNALGLDDTSDLKVVDVKFNRPAVAEVVDEGRKLDFVAIAKQGSLGLMAVCALIALKIFSGSNKKVQNEQSVQLQAGSEPSGLLPAGNAGVDAVMLRRQIAGALQNNPEKVRQLFSNWIEEKG